MLGCVICLVIWRMAKDGESKQFISSYVAEFVDYGPKPPLPQASNKGSVDFMLNQVSFHLGKVPVEVICDEQDKMIDWNCGIGGRRHVWKS